MTEITLVVRDSIIGRMDLVEEYKEAKEQGDLAAEDFLQEAINVAISVYGQAKKAGLLTEDGLSIREDVAL